MDQNPPKEGRPAVNLRIKFRSESVEQFIERYAVDVSRGGIFIRTREPLAVGAQLKLDFQFQNGSPLMAGDGTVVWIREFDPNRTTVPPGMGVRFDRLTPESQVVLEQLLAEKALREKSGIAPAASTGGGVAVRRPSAMFAALEPPPAPGAPAARFTETQSSAAAATRATPSAAESVPTLTDDTADTGKVESGKVDTGKVDTGKVDAGPAAAPAPGASAPHRASPPTTAPSADSGGYRPLGTARNPFSSSIPVTHPKPGLAAPARPTASVPVVTTAPRRPEPLKSQPEAPSPSDDGSSAPSDDISEEPTQLAGKIPFFLASDEESTSVGARPAGLDAERKVEAFSIAAPERVTARALDVGGTDAARGGAGAVAGSRVGDQGAGAAPPASAERPHDTLKEEARKAEPKADLAPSLEGKSGLQHLRSSLLGTPLRPRPSLDKSLDDTAPDAPATGAEAASEKALEATDPTGDRASGAGEGEGGMIAAAAAPDAPAGQATPESIPASEPSHSTSSPALTVTRRFVLPVDAGPPVVIPPKPKRRAAAAVVAATVLVLGGTGFFVFRFFTSHATQPSAAPTGAGTTISGGAATVEPAPTAKLEVPSTATPQPAPAPPSVASGGASGAAPAATATAAPEAERPAPEKAAPPAPAPQNPSAEKIVRPEHAPPSAAKTEVKTPDESAAPVAVKPSAEAKTPPETKQAAAEAKQAAADTKQAAAETKQAAADTKQAAAETKQAATEAKQAAAEAKKDATPAAAPKTTVAENPPTSAAAAPAAHKTGKHKTARGSHDADGATAPTTTAEASAAAPVVPPPQTAPEKTDADSDAPSHQIKVTSKPAGADVTVDGQVVGKTPYTGAIPDVTVPHFIAVRKEGFEPFEQMISASSAWSKAKSSKGQAAAQTLKINAKLKSLGGATDGKAGGAPSVGAEPDEKKGDRPLPPSDLPATSP